MDTIEKQTAPPLAPESQTPPTETSTTQPAAMTSRVTRVTPRERFMQVLRRRERKAPEIRLTRLPRVAAAGEQAYAFKFTGQAGEYFRIWIVNTFLVLITLGLWSPWAKIRKRQFMLRHTWVADANFEFHARPWPILRGRLIAGTLFIVYWFTGNLNPKYAAWVALCVALLAPWFVVNSLRFNMANTSYRNLRFAFDGTLRDATAVLWPWILVAIAAVFFPLHFESRNWKASLPGLISPVLLALFYPYLMGAFRLMLLNKTRLGVERAACETRVRTIYGVFLRASGLGAVLLTLLMLCAAVIGVTLELVVGREQIWYTQWAIVAIVLGFALPAAVALAAVSSYVQSRVTNVVFNLTTVANSTRVFSRLSARALFKNQMLNNIAILSTCGLAIPWAAVRTAKLRIESVSLGVYGDLDDIVADNAAFGVPSADAATEFFSLDISI